MESTTFGTAQIHAKVKCVPYDERDIFVSDLFGM